RSRSACRTQRRNDSGVQPTLPAIEAIAAHCDPCSPWCSSTIRTARSRSSGEYRVGVFFMAPSSQRLEPPEKPGRFTDCPVRTNQGSALSHCRHVGGGRARARAESATLADVALKCSEAGAKDG